MTNNLTLSQLGEQYLLEAAQVDEKIRQYRLKLKNESHKLKKEEILRIRSLLRLFYTQRCELRYTGKLLSEYYNKTERKHYGQHLHQNG